MDRRRGDPEVVGMDRFMQRMSGLSTGVAKLGDGGQQASLMGTTVVAAIDCSNRWRR